MLMDIGENKELTTYLAVHGTRSAVVLAIELLNKSSSQLTIKSLCCLEAKPSRTCLYLWQKLVAFST